MRHFLREGFMRNFLARAINSRRSLGLLLINF
jgi:hypothetical protein